MTDSSIAGERLRSFIERIERLEEEKKTIGTDISEVYAEAKSSGFDPKIIREVVKLRKMEAAERQERQALLETYLSALGMLADTPLGDAALKRAVDKLGTPVRLTEEEKAEGGIAAFDHDGTRMSIAVGR